MMDNIHLLSFADNNGNVKGYTFFCPICNGYHKVKTKNNIPFLNKKSFFKNMIDDFSCQGLSKDVQFPEQDRSFS